MQYGGDSMKLSAGHTYHWSTSGKRNGLMFVCLEE